MWTVMCLVEKRETKSTPLGNMTGASGRIVMTHANIQHLDCVCKNRNDQGSPHTLTALSMPHLLAV